MNQLDDGDSTMGNLILFLMFVVNGDGILMETSDLYNRKGAIDVVLSRKTAGDQ